METIKTIIDRTLEELHEMKKPDYEGSICFPRYANGKLRISEQELRICLIKNLYQAGYTRISVETPTKYAYSFKKGVKFKKKDDIQQTMEDCKYLSARLDLTLLNEDKDSFHTVFELKAHSGTTEDALYQDFVKLITETEDADHRFFIMIIDGNQEGHHGKDGAIVSIGEKLKRCFAKESAGITIDKSILSWCLFYDIDKNQYITDKIKAHINKSDK